MEPLSSRTRPDAWARATFGLLLRVAILAAGLYILWRVRFIIVVLMVAALLAFALAPVVDWILRLDGIRRLPSRVRRPLATSFVFVLLALLLVGVSAMVVQPIADEIRTFAANWGENQKQWVDQFTRMKDWYQSLPEDVRSWIESNQFEDAGARAAVYLQDLARHTLESGMFLIELILIPVLAFSFLTESRPLKREFLVFLPRRQARDMLILLTRTGRILQSYAIGQLILAVIAGAFTYLLLVAAGINYPLALAMLAALTRVIPVVGPVIGAIPILVIASLKSATAGLVVLVAFSTMHLVESKVIMPRLIGHRIELHPAIVIVVLLIGAEFFGMWGMFLAAPVAAVIKAVLNHFLIRPRQPRRTGPPSCPPGTPQEESVSIGRSTVTRFRGHSGAH